MNANYFDNDSTIYLREYSSLHEFTKQNQTWMKKKNKTESEEKNRQGAVK